MDTALMAADVPIHVLIRFLINGSLLWVGMLNNSKHHFLQKTIPIEDDL